MRQVKSVTKVSQTKAAFNGNIKNMAYLDNKPNFTQMVLQQRKEPKESFVDALKNQARQEAMNIANRFNAVHEAHAHNGIQDAGESNAHFREELKRLHGQRGLEKFENKVHPSKSPKHSFVQDVHKERVARGQSIQL